MQILLPSFDLSSVAAQFVSGSDSALTASIPSGNGTVIVTDHGFNKKDRSSASVLASMR
jgi:hypothetical protein